MDDIVNRLSRELVTAMAAAVAGDRQVEACHEKARAAGYDMKVSLEAVIGFAQRSKEPGLAKVGVAVATPPGPEPCVMNSNDRRFLRSLRIASGDTGQPVD